MNELNINEIPLPHDGCCCETYGAMTFDGCDFYFLVKDKRKIMKYSRRFEKTECIDTCKEYSVICYDFVDDCFWAMSNKHNCSLFKLSNSMKEIDCIPLPPCQVRGAYVTGMSFDCRNNSVLISTDICILSFDKETCALGLMKYYPISCVTGVLSLSPGFMVTAMVENVQYLYTYVGNEKLISERILPQCHVIKNILFDPYHSWDCTGSCSDIVIYILANKRNCYPYILEMLLDQCELGFEPADCNYQIRRLYENGSEQKPCPEHEPCKRQSCIKVLDSIAKMEAALSHILNAQGEKLQKVIASTDDVDKLLCANKDVNKTIINATHLEMALYSKLAALEEICAPCDREPCDSAEETFMDNDSFIEDPCC